MTWLMKGDQVLASVEVAATARDRARGLIGRDGIDGAILIRPARGVHTLGMRFAIDVAFLDKSGAVLETVRMAPNRVGRFRLRSSSVVEAEAGAFERWGLASGDVVEVRD